LRDPRQPWRFSSVRVVIISVFSVFSVFLGCWCGWCAAGLRLFFVTRR